MIPIFNAQNRLLKKAIEAKHVAALASGIKRKLRAFKGSYVASDENVRKYLEYIWSFSVEEILAMDITRMREVVKTVNDLLPSTCFYRQRNLKASKLEFKTVNEQLANIFDYTEFSKEKSSWCLGRLALELQKVIRICPYCNAETVYAYQVLKGSRSKYTIRKSSFDHYFPKARYPFFSVSLYNLIPACARCNSGFKGERFRDLGLMLHPYADRESFHASMKFRVLFKTLKGFGSCTAEDIDQMLLTERKDDKRCEGGVIWEELFQLGEIYSSVYKESVADILVKFLQYPKSYIDMLCASLCRHGIPLARFESLVYGSMLNADDINKNRLSKVAMDLYDTYCNDARCGA